MAALFEQLTKNLQGLSLGKKLLLAFIFAGGLASLAVLWLWIQKPDFRILYTNLSSEDAGLVIAKFQTLNVPYEFSNDGASLMVPAERVHELRLLLAGEGLPQGGDVGFEIFDESSFGATEFAQKLNYRRALQGELARTIAQIAEISNARVHLVIPEPSLFSEQEKLTSAAVVVNLKPGRVLSDAQVQGITHLVSGSVEGLKPDAVTIVDSRGKIRTTGAEGSSAIQMSGTQLEFQKNLEEKLQQKIQSMLAQVVGPDKALVRVSSILDLRQVELTEEKFDPETQVVRSEQRSQGNSNGTSSSGTPGGIPGVASNVPPGGQAQSGAGASNQNNTQNSSEVINYEISKTVSRVIEPFGTIKRLSVAALIDGTYEAITNDEGVTTQQYVPRGEEEMATLTSIVKKAMGFSLERKDELEVVNVPFKSAQTLDPNDIPEVSLIEKVTDWLPLVRQIIGPLLILLVLAVIIRPILKVVMAPLPKSVALPEGLAGPGNVSQIEEPVEQGPTKEEVIKLAGENPMAATQAVKKWISEG
ncbi:MAG: flagellar basal-body MS-ring/collar protein FliF [Nitrospirota bacterium]|nr:flagellar basal-body MS-ring/collar protein FliF [Nitrospirota bacterium]